MAKHDLANLREHLFDTLEKLTSKENPMEVERAKAIAGVSAQIINSAKVELQCLSLLGQEALPAVIDPEETGKFFQDERRQLPASKGLSTGKALGSNGETKRA